MKLISISLTLPLLLLTAACGPSGKSASKSPLSQVSTPSAASLPVVSESLKPVVSEPPPSGPILTDYSCSISAATPPKTMALSGDHPPVVVTVKNKGSELWMAMIDGRPARNLVNVGYHWVDANGTESEGTRTGFDHDIKPGESSVVSMRFVEMPAAPGEYTLRVEPIQEAVGWFSKKSGCKTEFKIKLTP